MFSEPNLSPFHQVFVYKIYVLPQLRQFWNTFRSKLANEDLYTAGISKMRLRL